MHLVELQQYGQRGLPRASKVLKLLAIPQTDRMVEDFNDLGIMDGNGITTTAVPPAKMIRCPAVLSRSESARRMRNSYTTNMFSSAYVFPTIKKSYDGRKVKNLLKIF